jgi:hypothetical protein
MSDVLIRGMEMPKFYDDCPIVPVQPHGRLIDADEYQKRMRNAYDDDWFTVLENTPTVIPANGENACFPVEEKG